MEFTLAVGDLQQMLKSSITSGEQFTVLLKYRAELSKRWTIECFGDRETHATSRIDSADAAGAMCDIQIFESLVLRHHLRHVLLEMFNVTGENEISPRSPSCDVMIMIREGTGANAAWYYFHMASNRILIYCLIT